MFDFCSITQSGFSIWCELFVNLRDFIAWIDQRINLNEGVIALVTLLVGIGMQNFSGARRLAGIGFIAVSIVLATVAILDGSYRTVRGVYPFRVEVPPLFRSSHGEQGSRIVYDDRAENSIQLISGKTKLTPPTYLARNCLRNISDPAERERAIAAFKVHLGEVNEIDPATITVFPSSDWSLRGDRGTCKFSWESTGVPIDYWEVYVVIPSGADGEFLYAHLRAKITKPTHVMIGADYRRMLSSLRSAMNE